MSSAVPQTTPTSSTPPPHEDRLLNVMAWLELHRKQLITGFGVFVAVIAVIYLWRHFRAEAEASANSALLGLRAKAGQPDSAPKPADFLKVAEEHASTSVAVRARLLAAGAFFADGRYGEAQTEFEKVRAGAGSGPVAAQAAYGAAACLDAQDKVDAAVTQYRDVIANFPDDSVAGQARLALARIEAARNQPAAALRLYDELLRDKDPGAFAQVARERRETLLRRNPSLAGTNAVPVVGTNVTAAAATVVAPAAP